MKKQHLPKSRWPWMLGFLSKHLVYYDREYMAARMREFVINGDPDNKICPIDSCDLCMKLHPEARAIGHCPCDVYLIEDIKSFAKYLSIKLLERPRKRGIRSEQPSS
jgi:hypothetical protein